MTEKLCVRMAALPLMNGGSAMGEYDSPNKDCDLVMKGGIASGVVYPSAICELARTYRFQSIGGTSVGAMAAAAAAAAEYGRGTNAGNDAGFYALERISTHDLARGGFLLGLFKPYPDLAPAFQTALAVSQSDLLTLIRSWPTTAWGQLRHGQHVLARISGLLRKHDGSAYSRGEYKGRTKGARWGGLLGSAVGALLWLTFAPGLHALRFSSSPRPPS
jgi:hypothetical protein